MRAAGDEEVVRVTVEDGVARVVLNRPERQNAWNEALSRGYFGALQRLAEDQGVRVILVSGAGGSFCTGGDMEMVGAIADAGGMEAQPSSPHWTPVSIGKPIIAAIAGPCFGLGMLAALACDIRFCSEDAKFCTAYARRGLVAELGMSWLLPRIVGLGRSADLMFSARVVRAPEALAMGLVSRVLPGDTLEAEAFAYARTMAAQCAPRALRTMKAQLYNDLDGDLIAAYTRAEALLDHAFTTPDFVEGVASWREQRPPAFPPLPPELARLDPPRTFADAAD
jgi:enoyl-CoA hydratase/carnithine racemase